MSQLTPSTQLASLAAVAPRVSVPDHVPVNGGTGPAGAMLPKAGLAAEAPWTATATSRHSAATDAVRTAIAEHTATALQELTHI